MLDGQHTTRFQVNTIEWPRCNLLLVGGPSDVRRQLEQKLKSELGDRGYPNDLAVIGEHWEYGKPRSQRGVPPVGTTHVLGLCDMMSHSMFDKTRKAAESYGVPFIPIMRFWTRTLPRLESSGIVPPKPVAEEDEVEIIAAAVEDAAEAVRTFEEFKQAEAELPPGTSMLAAAQPLTEEKKMPDKNMAEMRKVVAAELRDARMKKGLNQQQLAKRAGVTPATLSLVEAGKRGMCAPSFIRVLECLGLDAATYADFVNDICVGKYDKRRWGSVEVAERQKILDALRKTAPRVKVKVQVDSVEQKFNKTEDEYHYKVPANDDGNAALYRIEDMLPVIQDEVKSASSEVTIRVRPIGKLSDGTKLFGVKFDYK